MLLVLLLMVSIMVGGWLFMGLFQALISGDSVAKIMGAEGRLIKDPCRFAYLMAKEEWPISASGGVSDFMVLFFLPLWTLHLFLPFHLHKYHS